MELGQIVATIIGLIIGAALIYPLMAARLHHAKDSLALVIANHEKEIGRLKESGLTLVTYPYKEEHGKDGVIFDERRVEIGYKYQLFVNGTPCFQPHIVATDTLTKKGYKWRANRICSPACHRHGSAVIRTSSRHQGAQERK
ncbi:MAG: hypothetical protein IPG06_25610 [Haliea sp.]|nr:hypothetical protein [Haliea sp.]